MSKGFFSSAKRSRNLKGLVTSYEAGITPAHRRTTAKTDKSTRVPTEHSQRTFATFECDDEDELNDDFDSIFIDPEEERKIQSLLQFARKGKITPSNAFEVPVTVLNPQLTEGSLRFWKFACELLGASMCIYDKRVENMFLAVNQLFNNFVRSKSGEGEAEEESEETIYEKSRRKKNEAMKTEIAEMRENPNVTMLEIGRQNLEDTQKLNAKNSNMQFQWNPLFQKTLQAFDCNSLKGLFLNIFEVGKDGQICFLCDNFQCKAELEKLQLKESFDHDDSLPDFVEQQLSKLSFICKNRKICPHISQYLEQKGLKNEDYSNHLDLSQQFHFFKGKQADLDQEMADDQATELSNRLSENIDKFSFHYVQGLDYDISQNLTNSQRSEVSRFPVSEQCSKDFLIIEQDDWSVLDPRQLQFRGLGLHKKKSSARSQLNRGSKKLNNIQQLPFSQQPIEQIRSQVLKVCNHSENTRNRSYADKFLLPRSMDPFIEIHRKRIKGVRDALSRLHENLGSQKKQGDPNIPASITAGLFDETRLDQMPSQICSFSGSLRLDEQISTEGLKNLRTFGLRSIRQIKQEIRDRIEMKNSMKLSQLYLPISPASTFIVLLHLVNEQQLRITSVDRQRDIQISR